ncbi:uncharacterized protein M6B38_308885 [Iris pallida]|uniref:Uncharacterized protein n=1 Tax=Iris pallida TaxID=29817 RepID=A0AAX6HK33_IRIPA|nr:uncharacterized protein M6B38_308885 [Iris pallida]
MGFAGGVGLGRTAVLAEEAHMPRSLPGCSCGRYGTFESGDRRGAARSGGMWRGGDIYIYFSCVVCCRHGGYGVDGKRRSRKTKGIRGGELCGCILCLR